MVVRSGGVYFLVQVALLGRNVQYYFYVETQERSGSVQYHMHIRIELPRLYVNDTIGAEAFPLDQQQALGGDLINIVVAELLILDGGPSHRTRKTFDR